MVIALLLLHNTLEIKPCNESESTMNFPRKIKVGFFTGGIAMLIGFVIQFWAGLALTNPNNQITSLSEIVINVMLIEFSIVLIVIGAAMVILSFDRWLQPDQEE